MRRRSHPLPHRFAGRRPARLGPSGGLCTRSFVIYDRHHAPTTLTPPHPAVPQRIRNNQEKRSILSEMQVHEPEQRNSPHVPALRARALETSELSPVANAGDAGLVPRVIA
jgi:hypothetical protein